MLIFMWEWNIKLLIFLSAMIIGIIPYASGARLQISLFILAVLCIYFLGLLLGI